MKKLFVTFTLATLAAGAFAQGTVGAIQYQTVNSAGTRRPVYGVDSANMLAVVSGNEEALYAGREKLAGATYWAELYSGPAGAAAGDLKAVEGSLVNFRTGANAGLIAGKSTLTIPGTFGGDSVTLQLRVWGSQASSWAEVANQPSTPRGSSKLITGVVLGGSSKDNVPFLPPSLAGSIESFGLYVVPEPSVVALGALGIGALLLRRRK